MKQDCKNCFNFDKDGWAEQCEGCRIVDGSYQNWQPPFEDMVAGLAKPGQDIIASLTPIKADLLHMAIGVAGEAGELVDAIKKNTIYNKPLDIENVIEELGDLEFFMERIRQLTCITREQTIEANINKLGKRYGEKYSDTAAQTRADKQE